MLLLAAGGHKKIIPTGTTSFPPDTSGEKNYEVKFSKGSNLKKSELLFTKYSTQNQQILPQRISSLGNNFTGGHK